MTIMSRTETKTYGGFKHKRIDDGSSFFIRVFERWNGDTDIPKELQNPFLHVQDVERAIDVYNAKIAAKERELMTNVSVPTTGANNG